ncbi:MAG: hypothetical protein E7283_05420 [Lachnospiraceae bacterium]|nr:hypothetical protein [Lachnospiraceae bacterium]
MNGITVPMAIVDFIPVLMFFFAACLLLKDLYNKMTKGAYALLATGSIMVLIGGFYKALWKILYALNICDYPLLSESFFPIQGTGFLLVFLALVGMFTPHNKKNVTLNSAAVVPVLDSSMPFVILQIIGCAGMQFTLFGISLKMKKKNAAVCYIVAFIFMLAMGYLSAKFDDTPGMHWVAQLTNTISQGSLLLGTWILHKAGLAEKNLW